ncbi:hypothetical protein LSG25_01650 [Paralcaligenes sp. KSB-10]|uniref:AtuA-related protein n=1 Tax=Paralcaligenes sp. KSB-10 TaxID=2901142 RepID=UPI001E53A99C|nr:hypothetical protein [Paralcaligenes sp. KSB-10]UHL64637.1 hypothetical protein LSG25_01650 [Paralcaligenes sp. KSB-10]
MHDNTTVIVPLYRLAHSRTGDKGDISNVSVIAWQADYYPLLKEQLTEQAVSKWFSHRQPKSVRRYLVESIGAMNFVLDGILDGGVNDALNLDTHGKALSFYLLDFPIRVDAHLASTLPDIQSL